MKRRSISGAAAIEFALVGMVFVSLLLLAVETGWQMVIESALGAGARFASRFGSTGATVAPGLSPVPTDRNSSILQIVVQNSGGVLLASQLQITEASYANYPAVVQGGASTSGPGNATQVVQYTFIYTQPYITPIAAAITGRANLVHTVHVTVLNEPYPSN